MIDVATNVKNTEFIEAHQGDTAVATITTVQERTDEQNDHRAAHLGLKVASSLWFLWGVFHVAVGIAIIVFLTKEHPTGELSAIPGTLDVEFFGSDSTFASIPTMKQHGFNLAWIGVLVTISSVYVWRNNRLAVATSVVIGGLADLGYFLFVDLPGFAEPPGPQMTYIMAVAIAIAGYAYFTTNRFRDLQPT